jgi:succinyl-diaminopimelate desuccinylase
LILPVIPYNPPVMAQHNRASDPNRSRFEKLLTAKKKSMIRFLSDFCAIPTVNPPGAEYERCVKFLEQKLKSIGLSTRIVRVPDKELKRLVPDGQGDPRLSLIARWDVGAKRTLLLTGHYDVVPATANWKTDPFVPVIKGNKLFARGSCDMKGSDTAAIFCVEAMKEAGLIPPCNIELAFTPDEETGGYPGLGWLVKSRAIKADAAILLEGGGGETVGYAHRGVVWAKVTVHGKPSHASRPKDGINALEKAIPVILQYKALEKVYARRTTRYNTPRKGQRNPTLMIGGVSGGGTKINTVPDTFSFTIDRRLNPEDDARAVRAELQAVLKEAKRRDRSLKAEIEFPLYVESGHTVPEHRLCKIGLDAARAVQKHRPRLTMTLGFTDMHFLTNDAGIPTLGYGACGANYHADDEYVDVKSLSTAARFYAEVALRLGAGD